MKKFLLSFLLYFTFCIAYGQGETIAVTTFYGDGPGTLYDAINKANASTASGGKIVFHRILSLGEPVPDPFIPYTLTIFPGSSLPVLTKDNWRIYNVVSYSSINPNGSFSGSYYSSNVIINGNNNVPGPALAIRGQNSTCDIPWDNFKNFKATHYTVSNTNDSGPESLREALEFAATTKVKDSIFFNIPGQAPHVINLLTPLPYISKNLFIDGSTQPGFIDGKETVVLKGNGKFMGFTLYGCSDVEIYGLTFKNFSNGIGTTGYDTISGYKDDPSLSNITIGKKGKGNLLISNTSTNYEFGNGIIINVRSSSRIFICNNYIGTNADGDPGLGNSKSGIKITAANSLISDNIISGNGQHGICCANTYTYVHNGMNYFLGGKITGNKIGTDPSGNNALPNNGNGIQIDNAQDLFIGGELESDKNIISGNKNNGIYFIVGSGYVSNLARGPVKAYIYNNCIGTNASGTSSIPNTGSGIVTDSYNYGIYYIGKKGAENIIAFNKSEAISNGNSAVVRNNRIFNNEGSISSTVIAPPIINYRSPDKISGTASEGTIVQLFYDNGFNNNAQGKDFIAEVYPNSGNWSYVGQLSNTAITAIAIDTIKKQTSPFSQGSEYLLVTGTNNLSAKHNFSISPNPSSDYIQILLNTNEDGEIKLMSLTGSVILTDQITSGKAVLDIAEVKPGSYVMLINTSAGEMMQKVIITR